MSRPMQARHVVVVGPRERASSYRRSPLTAQLQSNSTRTNRRSVPNALNFTQNEQMHDIIQNPPNLPRAALLNLVRQAPNARHDAREWNSQVASIPKPIAWSYYEGVSTTTTTTVRARTDRVQQISGSPQHRPVHRRTQ